MRLSWDWRWPKKSKWIIPPRVKAGHRNEAHLLLPRRKYSWVCCLKTSSLACDIDSITTCRNYEKATLNAEDIASESQDLAHFHRAIFKKGSDLEVMASCVSFATQYRVPPGSLYNVSTTLLHVMLYALKYNMNFPRRLEYIWIPLGQTIFEPMFTMITR